MKFDLHMHTSISPCSRLKPETLLRTAKKRGLDGIAITDHNTIKGAASVEGLNRDRDFEIITGAEITTDKGHVLGYYLNEEIRSRRLFEVLDEIKQQGGIAVIAHPFRYAPWMRFRQQIKDIRNRIDGIEGVNSRMLPGENRSALNYAKKNNVPAVGGSDAHFSFEVGRAYTVFEGDLVKAIRSGKTRPEGSILLAPLGGISSFINKWIRRKIFRGK